MEINVLNNFPKNIQNVNALFEHHEKRSVSLWKKEKIKENILKISNLLARLFFLQTNFFGEFYILRPT